MVFSGEAFRPKFDWMALIVKNCFKQRRIYISLPNRAVAVSLGYLLDETDAKKEVLSEFSSEVSFGADPLKKISSKGGTLVHGTAGALRARDHLQAKPRHQDPQQLLRHGLHL